MAGLVDWGDFPANRGLSRMKPTVCEETVDLAFSLVNEINGLGWCFRKSALTVGGGTGLRSR
jgi:hypothetical protein